MTLLDDDIDDLLRSFRADEAVLDDPTRSRMWARICETVPDAPSALDDLDHDTSVRRLRPRSGPRRHRVLAVAAAVLVLLAVAGALVRSDGRGGGDPVTADPTVTTTSTTVPGRPRDLAELADRLATQNVVPFGSSDDVAYTHLVVDQSIGDDDGGGFTNLRYEIWVNAEGAGRVLDLVGGVDRRPNPGELMIGALQPSALMNLLDRPGAVEAALTAGGAITDNSGSTQAVAEALAYVGIPAPARSALLRYLHEQGFHPVTAPDLGSSVMRVEGPGPGGSTLQVDVVLQSGEVVALTHTTSRGGSDVRTYSDADLRADTR